MIDNKIQQELRAKYNPDGSLLRTVQLSLLDILVEFDRICRENNVTYWLDSGTLIGAARHGGFIPWDDDLDVCILRKDRKKLKAAMEKDLKAPFTFIDANSIKGYTRRWARVLNDRITVSRIIPKPGHNGETEVRDENIWLDVFFETYGNPAVSKKIDFLFGRCYRRRFRLIDDGKMNRFIGVCLYPFAQFLVVAARCWGSVFNRKTLIHDFGTGFYSKRKTEDVFPLGKIEFEGYQFPAPCNTDRYLSRIYGDWTRIPDNIENHNIFKIQD